MSTKLCDVNGVSDDDDKDTDVESLPEVCHAKPAVKINDTNVWKLRQNVPGYQSIFVMQS
jgi:hypothetical protein